MQNEDERDIIKDLRENDLFSDVFWPALLTIVHRRLHANSLFRLLDTALFKAIAKFFTTKKIVQDFLVAEKTGVDPNHCTFQLFSEVIEKWHGRIKKICIITHPHLCMDIFLRPEPDSKNFYSMQFIASSHEDGVDPGYESERSGFVPDEYITVHIQDPEITGNIDTSVVTFGVRGSNAQDIHIVSPDGRLLATNVSYDPQEDPLLLMTEGYHVRTQGPELISLINSLLQIVFDREDEEANSFADEPCADPNRCPQCRQPMIMGEGCMPGTPCIRCLRANRDQA
jgi:hypothetical protein